MGKLPKELQEKIRRAKSLRSQGGVPASPNTAGMGGKGINRQMRRRMKNQGVEGMEPIEAKQVIIKTDEGDLVINSPQVIKMAQQGMEIYQVIGKANASESDESGIDSETDDNEADASGTSPGKVVDAEIVDDEPESKESPNLNVQITDQDIELVAMQTGVSKADAEKALKETGGDLARAILNLKSK